MSRFSVVTWNVNSIRAREERVLAFLERHQPDVVCLQETKVTDELFPEALLRDSGYLSVFHGQKTYNGVAILSRTEATGVIRGMPGNEDDPQARVIAAEVEGFKIVNLYVPNGKSVGTDKYDYKLGWLDKLRVWLSGEVSDDVPLVVVGDYNIAPADEDVAFPEKWAESVLCHEGVRSAWQGLVDLGLHDMIRKHHEAPGPWSWWDYRRLAFPKGDGIRTDHLLASKVAADMCTEAFVDRSERKGKGASDHAPVFAVFER